MTSAAIDRRGSDAAFTLGRWGRLSEFRGLVDCGEGVGDVYLEPAGETLVGELLELGFTGGASAFALEERVGGIAGTPGGRGEVEGVDSGVTERLEGADLVTTKRL